LRIVIVDCGLLIAVVSPQTNPHSSLANQSTTRSPQSTIHNPDPQSAIRGPQSVTDVLR
jgi:hypothetical protein